MHSETCRARIEEAMAGDEEGQEALRKEKEKEDHKIAAEVERQIEADKEADVERTEAEELFADEGPEEKGSSSDVRHGGDEASKRTGDDVETESKRRRTQESDQKASEAQMEEDLMDLGDSDIVQSLMNIDIAEMYSPPRVTAEGKRFGLKPGEAMDLSTGWDFRKADHREKAMKYIKEKKPRLVIGSPMCTMFSVLQNWSAWTEDKDRRWIEAKAHIDFMMEVYKEQDENGRWFLHEHPASATSWQLAGVKNIIDRPGVLVSTVDQCMYGLETYCKNGKKGKSQETHEVHDELRRNPQ